MTEATITTGSDYSAMGADELRESIRSENRKARNAARKSLEHVRACGEMLITFKEKIEHGSWLYELRGIGIKRRTATNYMRIASEWETVSHLNHGVRDALKLLSRGEDAPQAKSPAPSAPSAPAIIEAEVMEAEDDNSKEPELTFEAPAPAEKPPLDPYLQIMHLLPDLSAEQYRELVKVIQTRWLR